MSKSILGEESKDISGFYYDMQKRNPMLRVTLHANTKPPKNTYDEWVPWISADCKDNFPLKEETDIDTDLGEVATDDNPYGAVPICSSIVNEDFTISIANNWGEFQGSQSLQDTFNGIFKQFEPYSNFIGENLGKIIGEAKGYITDKSARLTKAVNKVGEWMDEHIGQKDDNIFNKAGNILSRSLVVQGTRFKYYGGTGISFSNLGMRFTLFADHIQPITYNKDKGLVIDENKGAKWMTPDDQLLPILPYSVGEYVKLTDGIDGAWIKEMGLNNIAQAANTFLGWQMPPGGFKADVQYIDTRQKGTLMLKIGPYYRLINLVVQDIQLNYSKNVAKYLDSDTNEIKTCPLYCDVNITLSPASKYSNKTLKEFVMNRTTINNGSSNNSVYNLEKEINESLFGK